MTKKELRQRLEALGARVVWGLFAALPLDAASGLGGWLGRTVGPLLGGVNRVARRNLKAAFPEKSDAEIKTIIADMWDNIGRVAGEFPHLKRIAAERVELIGGENIDLLRDDGKAGIFISGHMGNWEVNGAVAAARGLPLNLVYRAANNPYVEDLYRKGRADACHALIQKGPEGARQALITLKKGGHLGMLVDQKMNDGVAIPFFGRDAMTAPAQAVFATKFKCPLVPARVERIKGAHFRVTVLPPMEFPHTNDNHEDNRLLLVRINALLEEWIRERPAQWLWVHRRWPE
ncbi:putative Lipid A biosynthesis (KDO)2-(lauroyl)-lipid IVA acyltransferase [Magnetospirillum sp. XM-1]|uniref:lysophospholipid acyltransferase family protein n=1 Tax=Magnetospirillum sp. XM-1 TaxID=1663591 RepID=UPI00073E080A|nr:lysophospholipid acyltransferase family protein [Magnetospirillum sp. XM-1]CUW37380.1 putative Lipid A biosynthesis (KDO)2-(lauroyl)-lipid IVA acyltransferase [Magnetospirillum sp. XM-1]